MLAHTLEDSVLDPQVREIFEMGEPRVDAWGKLNSCFPLHQKSRFSLPFYSKQRQNGISKNPIVITEVFGETLEDSFQSFTNHLPGR